MLNRRGFLGRLTAGIAAMVVARKLPAQAPLPRADIPFTSADPADYDWKDNLLGGVPNYPQPQVISSPSWCSASYDGGHLTISPAVGALCTGTYAGTVRLSDANHGITTVPVSLTVTKKAKAGRKRKRGHS